MLKPEHISKRNLAILAAVAFAVSACAPAAQIRSNKSAAYAKEPRRLFVVTDIGAEWGNSYYNGFKSRFTSLLSDCGAASEVSRVTDLELDDNAHQRRARKFNADAILNIRRTAGTKNGYGMFIDVTYDARMTDVESRKAVWRSNVKFMRGLDGLPDRGQELAADIVKKLKEDGILRSCTGEKAA